MSFILTIISTIKSFISSTEEGYSEKSDNFIEKAPPLVEAGILPQEATEALIATLKKIEEARKQKNAAIKKAHDSRKEFVDLKTGGDKQLREYKKAIDMLPSVPIEAKRELGLVDEKKTEESNNKRPDLKIKMVAGVPQINYTKSPMHGIKLYSKINDGEYNFETTVNLSHFDDTRSKLNPKETEVREYYAYYLYNGKTVGKKSNVARVVLEPIE